MWQPPRASDPGRWAADIITERGTSRAGSFQMLGHSQPAVLLKGPHYLGLRIQHMCAQQGLGGGLQCSRGVHIQAQEAQRVKGPRSPIGTSVRKGKQSIEKLNRWKSITKRLKRIHIWGTETAQKCGSGTALSQGSVALSGVPGVGTGLVLDLRSGR